MALFVTANLGRHVSVAEFVRNVRILEKHDGRGTIIGFQEIDEADTPDEHFEIDRILGDDYAFAGWESRVPIAVADRWRIVRQEVVKAARGLARLSPTRVITEAVAQHVAAEVPRLVVLNVHFPRKDRRLLSRWRRVRDQLKKRIRYWHGRGYTVVWMGDVNRVRLGRLHSDERVLAHRGLDWIRCVEAPGGVQLVVEEAGTFDFTIDGHDGVWVRVSLNPPKAS